MKDLLPYYERELSFLRQNAREFARRYPKIASRLQLSADGCEDPHVERMIEAFALLSARVSKRLEDSYPEFAESLLNVLYPHYLRPFPSCAIVRFGDEGSPLQRVARHQIPRGTRLESRPVRGSVCTFRTAWDLELVPVRVRRFCFGPVVQRPSGASLPDGVGAMLSLVLEQAPALAGPRSGPPSTLRFFIDAEPSVAAALRDALFMSAVGVLVEQHGRWGTGDRALIEAVGFADDEALIDLPDNAHDAYRHMTEYFAYPDKYNFFDLRLDRLPPGFGLDEGLTLHFMLTGVQAECDSARSLASLNAANLRLDCVPVVNLFARSGEPIRVTGRSTSYPVVADGRRASAFEVYSIDSVRRIRQTGQGERITEFRPFFALHHGETPGSDGNYWISSRDERLAERSPGYETGITVVETDFDPFGARSDVLSIELTCTNRDLPSLLPVGAPGGDLSMDGDPSVGPIRFLRKPTLPARFEQRREGLWRLISHLSLNQLSISGDGLQAFRAMLSLYDLRQSPLSRRQIEGVRHIEQVGTTAWLGGQPFSGFVRGIEVRMSIDEDAFVGAGVDVFARVIDRFLGLYVHLNSFVRLVLLSSRSGEVLIRCKPRSGALTLA